MGVELSSLRGVFFLILVSSIRIVKYKHITVRGVALCTCEI